MPSFGKRARRYRAQLLGEEPEEDTLAEEINELCTCSYKTRLYGFIACVCLGMCISFISFLSFGTVATRPAQWATLYTLGNIVSLAATFFLVGPMRQIRQMTKPTRYIAAIIYVLSLIGTLCAAFIPEKPNALLCIVCVIVQFCALFWYSLSYIPFARRMFKSCAKTIIV
eukprot:TRINITY_DN57_c0_g1_i1.p1 TRINITY_DN57_c0_g1~~TRINITY_DN57_c0_g1_i1.p1  ORF type:complete len:170 (+),score=25.80 TRINITY_DN57_c0_g1_i1:124-633(+)